MMNKTVLGHLMIVALLGSLLLTGCKKEEVFNLRLTAEKLTSDSKTYVDGTAVGWVAGDIVRINGTEYTLVDDASVSGAAPVGSALLAFHPASISDQSAPSNDQVTVTIPSTYNYETVAVGNTTKQKLDMPMVGVAAAHATSMTMYHLCSAVDVTVNNTFSTDLTIDYIRLTGTGISGTKAFTVAANSTPTPVTDDPANGDTVMMNFSGTTIAATTGTLTVQIPVLPVTADVKVEVCGHLAAGVFKYTRTATGMTMSRAKVHPATIAMASSGTYIAEIEGVIPGVFSIGTNKKVYFSKGNLQYIGSASTPYWKFAENQWDYLGSNGQGSNNQDVDRDLFGWGTSGYNHNENHAYQPYATSTTNTDYYAYNNQNYYLRQSGQSGQADWGYNAISNGGNTENLWRTLTSAEWDYLLNSTKRTSTRYAKATVNSKIGIILFPDSYTHPSGVTPPTNINTYDAAFNSNSYDGTYWTAMESAGCLFLPTAGIRTGTNLSDVGSLGNYWSSTPRDAINSYGVYFNVEQVGIFYGGRRDIGRSVRLVQIL